MRSILTCVFITIGTTALAQTRLTIIGSQHNPTAHENVDSLLNVIKKIKPDVILIELDTALMDPEGNLKGRAITVHTNENDATKSYKVLNPNLIIRRFDIEDRSFYYDSHHTFATENKLGHAIDSLYHYKKLDAGSMQLMTDFYTVNNKHDKLSGYDLITLNSQAYKELSKQRQFMLYKKELEVIANTPELKQYYDFWKDDGNFWDRRNKAMIKNILGYIKDFSGKNIVVLTGAMHTYYLTDGLMPAQQQYHFKLNNLPSIRNKV